MNGMKNMSSMDSSNSNEATESIAQGDRLTGSRLRRRLWKVLSPIAVGALLVSGLSVVVVSASNTVAPAPSAEAAVLNSIPVTTPSALGANYTSAWNTSGTTVGSWTGSSTFNPNWLYEGWSANPYMANFSSYNADGSLSSGALSPLITGITPGTPSSGLDAAQLDTLALDSGTQDGLGTAEFYGWGWDSSNSITNNAVVSPVTVPTPASAYTTVLGFPAGQTGTVRPNVVYFVPNPNTTGQKTSTGANFTYNYWSGGEVDQQTGRIYFSPGEASTIANSEMMIFDPKTGNYNASGTIQPANASQVATGRVASDMTIDSQGNAYLLLENGPAAVPPSGGAAISTEYLAKVTPGAPGQWTYSLVTPLWYYNGTTYATMNGNAWAMGFLNGYLYANATAAAGANYGQVVQINPRTGISQTVGGSTTTGSINGTQATVQDFASPQSAAVLNGTVYNDAAGNGQIVTSGANATPGAAGETVQLYNATGQVIGQQTTNALGQYSFLMPNSSTQANYYVRVVQPQINGANAVQTWSSVTNDNGGAPNGNPGQLMSYGQVTTATAPQTPYVDTPAPAAPTGASPTGGTADLTQVAAYTEVQVNTANDVTTANFAVSSTGSYGDSPSDSTIAQNGPQHVEGNISGQSPNVYLGAQDGFYTNGSNTADAHDSTDDGVTLQTANWAAPAQGQVLAAGNNYTFNYALSGNNQTKAKVYAWLGATSAGSLQWGSGVTGSADKLTVSVPSGTQAAGAVTPEYLRVDASSNSSITASTPDNATGAYAPAVGSTASNTQTWTSDGETEDYQVGVANAVVHLAIGTDGAGSYGYSLTNVSNTAPQSTSDTITVTKAGTVSSSVSHAVQTVGSAVVVTPSSVPSAETPGVVALYNTITGDQITTLTPAANGAITIPGTDLAQGADVTLLLTYAQPPSATVSSWSLSPTTITADGTTASTVTVNVNSAGNTPLTGQTVTITAPADVKVSAVKDNADGTYTATLTSTVAGSYPISANVDIDGTATQITNPSATQTLTVTSSSASAATSSFSVSSTAVTADGKTGVPVTVTTKDVNGNATTGSVVLTVESPAEFANGTQTTTVTTDDTGAGTAQITSTKVGGYTVTATVGGTDVAASPATANVANFVAGPPDAAGPYSSWTVTPTSSVAADGTSAFTGTVTVGDATGNPVGATAVLVDVPSGVTVSSGGTALTPTAGQVTVTTDATTGTATVTFTSTTAGTYSVGAYLGTTEIGSKAQLEFTSSSASATTSSFSVSSTAVTADGKTGVPVTVTTKDVNGNATTGSVVLTVESPAEFANGTQTTTVTTDDTGAGTAQITSTKVGGYKVTATVGGTDVAASPATANVANFVAGPPDVAGPYSSWSVTPTSSVPADGTSAFTGTVKLGDANGNPVNASPVLVDVPTRVTASSGGSVLTPTGGQVTLQTDVTGTATVTFTSTTANATPYLVGAYSGTAEIGSKASLVFSSTAAVAGNSSWSVAPTTSLTADGTQAFTATVNLKDAQGSPVVGDASGISVASSPAAGPTFGAVTDNGDGSYTVQLTSTTAGVFQLTASVGGTAIGSANTVTFVAGTPSTTTSTWAVAPSSVASDGKTAATGTVTVTDVNNNPVTGVSVLVDVPSGVTATDSSGNALAVTNGQATIVTGANGQATVAYTSSSAGNYTVGAYLNGPAPIPTGEIGSKVPLNFTVGVPFSGNSTLAVDNSNGVIANGQATHTITAAIKDSNGQPVPGTTVDFTTTGGTLSASSQVTGADGTAQVTISSTVADTMTVSATVGGAVLTPPSVDAVFVAGPPDPTGPHSVWTVTPSTSLPADGTSSFIGTVTVGDTNGNTISNAPVAIDVPTGLTATSGGTVLPVTNQQVTVTTNNIGQARVSFTSTTAGSYSVGAYVNTPAALIGSKADLVFTSTSANAANSTWSVTPTTQTADGTSVITATVNLKDSTRNAVTGDASDIAIASSPAGPTIGATTDNGDGSYTVQLTSTTAGVFQLTASVGGTQIGSANTVTFVAGPPSLGPDGTSNLTVSLGSVPADGTTTQSATATILDANGNQVPAQSVLFTVSSGAVFLNGQTTITGSTDPTTGAPVVETITSTKAGSYTVTAAVNGTALKGSPATVTFGAGQAVASTSTFAVTPAGPILANGTAAYTATVTANDANGNPVPGQTISFALPSGLTGPTTATTGTDGVATATYTATVAGTYPIDAYLDAGQTQQLGTEQDLVYLSAAPPPAPALNPSNGTFASGSAVPGDTIKVTDANGDLIGTGTVGSNGTFNVKPLSPTQGNGTTITVVDVSPGGVDSQPASVVVDAIAPGAPTVDPTNGSKVTGTADAGTTVTVSVPGANGSTIVLCTATASASGAYSCTPKPKPANGAELTVTATDPAQNLSPSVTVTVDSTPPTAPVVDPSNGKNISGSGDPGTSVTVTDPSTGGVLCTTTITADGTFSCVPNPTPSNGENLSVTSTDPSGNVSGSTTITINTTPPPPPVVDPSNGTTITGTTEPGDSVTVSVTDPSTGDTTVLCTTKADATTGAYSCEPSPAPSNGDDVTVTVTDPAGNTSFPGNVTVDTVPPAIPVVNPSNGSKISGTAEVNSTITVTDSTGKVLCTTTATAITGSYSCVPSPAPGNGATITVTATDASGNVSKPGTVTISTTAPAAPVVNPSNGSEISGTATPGTTVTVEAGGSVLCTVTVPASGTFSCVPSPTPGNGQLLDVIATDPAGNESAPTPVTIDSIAPAPPVITAPTSTTDTNNNKPVVSGTGEPGATVDVTDSNGDTVCTATVAADGTWSCTGTTALPDGSNSLNASQSDAAGNVSAGSPSVSFEVDTKAPAAPVLKAPATGSTSGNSVPTMSGTGEPGATIKITDELGRTVCTTTVDANGNWACGATSASGTGTPGSTVTLKDNNGNVYCTVTVAANGTWTCPPVTFSNAQHTLTATQTDAAGNVSAAASATFTVKAAPAITSPAAGSTTTNQTPTISGTASPGDTITVTSGSSTTALCTLTAGTDGSWSCVLPTQPAGSTTLTITDTTLGTSTTVTYTTVTVDRIQGADRYATAAAAAAAEFPNGAPNVIVAVGTNYPDALSAVPAAAKLGAPILLTTVGAVPASTMNELNALHPSQVIVLGTTASVSAAAFNQIQGGVTSKPKMVRIGGVDRYATSRGLAQYVWGSIGVGTVFVATGQSFADAEAAAPAAAKAGAPLVLVNGDSSSVDSATTQLLQSFGVSTIHVIGSTSELNSSVLAGLDSIATADRTSGPNVDATAIAVSQAFFPNSDQVFIARDDDFADALTGGAAAAHVGAPMLLTNTQTLSTGVTGEVQRLKATQVHVMGDPNSITNSTLSTLVNGLNTVQ